MTTLPCKPYPCIIMKYTEMCDGLRASGVSGSVLKCCGEVMFVVSPILQGKVLWSL